MYQLKLFKALSEPKKEASLTSTDFEAARNLAHKAKLCFEGKYDKNKLEFIRMAYIIITKL